MIKTIQCQGTVVHISDTWRLMAKGGITALIRNMGSIGGWVVSAPAVFTFSKRCSVSHSVGGWIDHRAGLAVWRTGNVLHLLGIKPRSVGDPSCVTWLGSETLWLRKIGSCKSLAVVLLPDFCAPITSVCFGTQPTPNNIMVYVHIIYTSVCFGTQPTPNNLMVYVHIIYTYI
jgi:hypothetical protein